MKLQADTKSLLEAMTVAAGVSPTKTPKPAIQHVLLVADDSGVQLRATDMDRSVRVHVADVQVDEPGVALIPGRQVAALLKETDTPTVSLYMEADKLVLKAGTGKFTFACWAAEDFPAITFPDGPADVELSGDVFLGMVERTAFAAAREETRYAINGILLRLATNTVTMVGTDGRRLAMNVTTVGDAFDDVRDAIIPVPALQSAAKAVRASGDASVAIVLTEDKAVFRVNGYELACQLLDNRFPDFEQVIPRSGELVSVSAEALAAAVRQVAVLSDGDIRAVRLEFRGGEVAIATDSSRGHGEQTVPVRGDVNSAITFNPDYLLDALKVAGETIDIALGSDDTPARLDLMAGATYVLMPISGS